MKLIDVVFGSLGTSVNALGKSHHIIQTVNTPSEIFRIIQEIWNATEFTIV